ncbi:MAG: hypothetical protein JO182_18835 [Acidobacteriaceae bacterium]|nr:hypothetical protein [Acidobacteriaceae bacterium]MBV9036552.1 hypothetical protein [Acidobacteriaceae bacterium]MBV9309135.1 hypothetical protein [Acidobacteriaceae bacterium]
MTTSQPHPAISRVEAIKSLQLSLAPNRFALALLIVSIATALVQVISYQSSLKAQAGSNPNFFLVEVQKTPLYYTAYAIQLALAFSAGLIAIISTNFRTIDRTYLIRFWFLIAAALLMAAKGYTVADLYSSKLVDSTGPVPFLFFVLVFIGANKNNWRVLEKVIAIESVLLCCLVAIGLFNLHTFTRYEAVITITGYLNILFWPAAWIVLKPYPQNSWFRHLRFGPMLVYVVGSTFVQTRLNFVMIFALMIVYAYTQRKRRVPQAMTWLLWAFLAVWVCLFVATFLRDSKGYEIFNNIARSFYSRLDEDTRTGQVRSFAQSVRVEELLLGRGSFAKWDWDGLLWKGGTDIGYLTLLFYGGLPLLIGYIAVQVIPSLYLFSNDIEDWQIASAGVVLLFAIRMFSSSYPGENPESYCLLLCTGACIYRSPWPRSQRFIGAMN